MEFEEHYIFLSDFAPYINAIEASLIFKYHVPTIRMKTSLKKFKICMIGLMNFQELSGNLSLQYSVKENQG